MKNATPNLDALAKEWNIDLVRDIVVDVSPVGQLFGTGPLTPLASQYPYHEITKDFRVMTAFHTARSAEAGKGTVDGVTAQSLLQTSADSWAETDLTLRLTRARTGVSISLGAGHHQGEPAPSPLPRRRPRRVRVPGRPPGLASPTSRPPPGRVVVLGDSDFASNGLLGFQGNLNRGGLGLRPISIRPREPGPADVPHPAAAEERVSSPRLPIPGTFVVLGTRPGGSDADFRFLEERASCGPAWGPAISSNPRKKSHPIKAKE
jgi:hypothetical protein